MNRSALIRLISVSRQQDKNGVWQFEENSRAVFANVKSASAHEFFEGGRNGLNPQYVFTMFAYDYRGEGVVEYDGARYGVYRTYRKSGDTVELYAERKGGTNRESDGG